MVRDALGHELEMESSILSSYYIKNISFHLLITHMMMIYLIFFIKINFNNILYISKWVQMVLLDGKANKSAQRVNRFRTFVWKLRVHDQ
jgi:hypothetical protein